MAGASDKARFYLEQSVPELQELEQKHIFSKDEISSIAKKRAKYEHKVNSRGSHPSDFARYAEYEMNLDALRRKRVKRLGLKVTAHSGQRRIFFILDRATKKFHGDIGLWMQYIEYTRKQKSNKKMLQIWSTVLRLHPNKPELWIYAAKYATDVQADLTGARTYLQRGLRFCKSSRELWLEYAKLEMIYIAKIVGRQRILGLDQGRSEKTQKARNITDTEFNADMIALPTENFEEEEEPSQETLGNEDPMDQSVSQELSSSPVLNGAIPQAIFEEAMKQFSRDQLFAHRFFDLLAGFSDIPCSTKLLQHVVEYLLATAPASPYSQSCYVRLPIIGIDANSAEFAAALRLSLGRLQMGLGVTSHPGDLAELSIHWLMGFVRLSDMDHGIRKALTLTVERTIDHLVDSAARMRSAARFRRDLKELERSRQGEGVIHADPSEVMTDVLHITEGKRPKC
ncbi:MAG: U3 snoRNP protein [Peltula sp. TS41687]|nr:MAG: U3 snoRNP protein [Peltula sp. TS41687]